MHRLLPLVVGLFLLLFPTLSWAQDDADAMELFREGRDAISRGDYNLACAKFEQSNALDKRVGTLLNLALCEEKRTRLVRALAAWRSAAELAKRLGDERETEAVDRASQLEPRIPKLTLALPPNAPAGTQVRLEGLTLVARTLEASELGVPIVVDPGQVNVTVILPDGAESTEDITVVEGDSKTITLTLPSPRPVHRVPDAKPDPEPDSVTPPVDGMLVAGIVLGGLGLAGVGVGFGFGAKAKSEKDESNDSATTGGCVEATNICGLTGLELRDSAIGAAKVSTVLVAIGGAFVAAGVTLIVVTMTSGEESDEPDATASKLRLGVTPAGVRAQLTW